MGMEEGSAPSNGEVQLSSTASDGKQRATMAGLTLASGGWINNFIVFMIGEFNVKSIDAAKLWNVVNGCTAMFPVLGAIVADSFLGSFSVICISSIFSLLGIILLLICSTIDSLRPPPCDPSGPTSCISPSRLQLSILYLAITLATIGVGGTRFTLGSMGADQFNHPKHQWSFFNWYMFAMYTSIVTSTTAITYVEDDVSWGWGFGICVAANVVGLVVFVAGSRFYHHLKPKGSPFTGLARVVVAAVQKRNVVVSNKSEDYYDRADDGQVNVVAATEPSGTFKFLNRAALITEGDTKPDGSIAKLWKLCTLQQVEDLKTLIRLSPLWSTCILLSTPLAVQMSLTTLQAITMNRHLGPHFKIPAGSMLVFIPVSTCLTIIFVDQFFFPAWQKVTGRFPPPLQRIGIGHVLCVLSMVVSAIVESNRLKVAHDIVANSIVPMSALWLVPQLALAGMGEAFHFPGNTALFYQGLILLILCSTIDSLRPPPCDPNGPTSCIAPSTLQLSILYLAITLATIGVGGTRFTLGTMGADQFDNPKHQWSFFNWSIFASYTSVVISTTAIIYVEDSVSWGWGFGIGVAANVVGLVIFVAGSRFYRHLKPKGSPFTDLARVVVAALRKRNVAVSNKSEDYYCRSGGERGNEVVATVPSGTFKFLNRAALKIEGDIKLDGSIAKVWRLCTLQQVEDLKSLIRLSPLWSTGILLSIPLAVQTSLATLQAITMDRHLGPLFKIPPGSMLVFLPVSTCLTIIFVDRFFFPMATWQKVTGRFPPPLQRIGIGHMLCALSMAVSAVVESNRLKEAHNIGANSIVPMSALWLVPQLALAGMGEAFHFPGNISLFYQEFPAALKSTATSMVAMMIALAYYLSTAVVGIVQRKTNWLPDNINEGRMDKVYWVLFGLGGVNFVYFLICAWFYKYRGLAKAADGNNA
ncbi:hypothetical protein RHSIM_Rhsim13G0090900 [Rhododendron simsii]|uniref:Uncharacterized protein n=1 Tax=Rhododendron simsii TaxID=118357 RepID=A0A834G3M6_RHOSS|nr:hypothetical protein RHSIM_Rhsim13G0090900 [Rhododendron simsii]